MAGNRCTHARCRNPIRAGEEFCHLHGGRSASELDAGGPRSPGSITIGEVVERAERRRFAKAQPEWQLFSRRPASAVPYSPMDRTVLEYTRHFPVNADAIEAVLVATDEVVGTFDITSPLAAAQNRERIDAIAQQVAQRIGEHRVSVMEVTGLVRRTAREPRRVSAGVTHKVLVLDRGTEHEVAVDPFIVALAPVRSDKADAPVLQSGLPGVSTSPYADSPWVGSVEDYLDNGHIEWQSDRFVR